MHVRVVNLLFYIAIVLLVGSVLLAARVGTDTVLFVLTLYTSLWSIFVVAIRATIRGKELHERVSKAEERGKEFRRFSTGIMLVAFLPLMAVLVAIGIRAVAALR